MKSGTRRWGRGLTGLLALLLVLAGLLWLRSLRAETAAGRTEVRVPQAESAAPLPDAPSPTVALPSPTQTPAAVTPRPAVFREPRYTDRTLPLVDEMVSTYRSLQSAGMPSIRALLERLKAADPELGLMWEKVMEYWDHANTALEIHYDVLPDGLPEDDSLCLVVLGFQLLPDGGMEAELVGRCEAALASAKKYPRAYVLVTGGGTAYRNGTVTEAGVMAEWLEARGLDPERLIVEDRSLTTAENAAFSDAILYDAYPQIRSLAIISSDYHIGMGSLLFNAAAQLRAYETGEQPYAVVSNAAFPVPRMAGTENAVKQASFLWTLMDPHY